MRPEPPPEDVAQALYEQFYDRTLGIVTSLIGDRECAIEATHEAFVRALERFGTLELIRYLDSLPVEGKEQGWLRIQQRLYSPAYRASRKRLRWSLAAAFILAALLLFHTPSVNAWGRDFISTILVKMPGPLRNLVTDFIPLEKGDPLQTTDPEKQMRSLFSGISFKPLVVDAGCEGWVLSSIEVKSGKTGAKVTLEYESKDGTLFTLEEEPVSGPRSSAAFYDADDTQVTEVTVRGISISILSHKSGAVNVWWIEQGLALYLSGRSDADTAADFIDILVLYTTER